MSEWLQVNVSEVIRVALGSYQQGSLKTSLSHVSMQPNNITESAHVCNKQGPVCYERRSLWFDLTKWGGQPLPVGAKGVFPVLLRWVGCPSCSQWVRSRSSQRCAIQLRYAPPNMWEQMLQIMLPFFLLFPPPPVCFCFLSRVKSKCLFFGWAYVVTGWSLHDARVPNGTATCPREKKFITGWWWSVAEILQDWGKIRRRKCRITQWLTDDKAVLAH